MVFSLLRLLHGQQQGALPLYRARLSTSWAPSFTLATWPRRTGAPFLRATMMLVEVFRALHAGVDLDDALLLQRAYGTHRQVLVLAAHGIDHLVGSHAKGFHGLRVEVDVDFALGATHQSDRAHAAHIFQAAS
jgi:hypothetical protein